MSAVVSVDDVESNSPIDGVQCPASLVISEGAEHAVAGGADLDTCRQGETSEHGRHATRRNGLFRWSVAGRAR